MSKPKHSQGPWKVVNQFYNQDYKPICGPGGLYVGYVNMPEAFMRGHTQKQVETMNMTNEVCNANACLIATAPELLDALIAIVQAPTVDALKQAHAAIAKATGDGE